jgi:uncharacterized protein Yka (UPF0111/DUF47 family)
MNDTIKSIERHVDRLQTEHLQMLVMLEKSRTYFQTLGILGGLQPVQSETALQISKEIEALVRKVTTP